MMRLKALGAVVGTLVALGALPAAAQCMVNSDCDDGDSCTLDLCNEGTCINELLLCANGSSCGGPIITLDNTGQAPLPQQACTPNPNGEPTLVVNGDLNMTLECGVDTWTDPGASACDAECMSIPVRTFNSGNDSFGPGPNTCAEGTYSVQYVAVDSQGKTVSAIRSVKVDDTIAPTFTLRGATHLTLQCGHPYAEPGWDAFDFCYGDVSPQVIVSGYPNGWVAGTYTVTYTLTDPGGNSAPTLTRTVDVVNCPY